MPRPALITPEIPATLNGFPVIAALPDGDRTDSLIVLVRRDDEHTPFVTAQWTPRCETSWNCGEYLGTLAEGLASLVERAMRLNTAAKILAKAINDAGRLHDERAAPPKGFTRYRIEMPIHHSVDSSALLERMQECATELYAELDEDENGNEPEDDFKLREQIENEVSVQAMEG